MAYRVVWSNSALADVNAIAAYIAKDSPAYARTVVKRLITLTRTLSRFPNLGRQVPEYGEAQDSGVAGLQLSHYLQSDRRGSSDHCGHSRQAKSHLRALSCSQFQQNKAQNMPELIHGVFVRPIDSRAQPGAAVPHDFSNRPWWLCYMCVFYLRCFDQLHLAVTLAMQHFHFSF